MIGGYLSQKVDEKIYNRLINVLMNDKYHKVPNKDIGFLFYNNPYPDFKTASYLSDKLTILS